MTRTSARPARFLVFAAGVLIALSAAAPPEYPSAADLPSRPEMPNPLVTRGGAKLETKRDWFERGRPELKALFDHYMYGTAPDAPSVVSSKVEREDDRFLAGKATLREITLKFGPAGAPPIHLLLIVPNDRKRRAPVFVGPNFYGNHTVVADPKVALPTVWVSQRAPSKKAGGTPGDGRGTQVDTWAADAVVGRGYALATFYCGDVAPDHPGHTDGVHPHYPGYDWGTVRAWAWGTSRVADYLTTLPEIDRAKMAVVGHSRLGKAALVAGAYDDRFAVVISHQAGCGGSAPSRGKVGESVKQINDHFPHWFNAAFKTFNDRAEALPMDQHELVALVAPRAVLFSNAQDDAWANPEGQFQALKAAEPVYKLLKAGGLESDLTPPTGKLSSGTLGYVIRPGKHSMTREDWGFFLDFADRHLGRR